MAQLVECPTLDFGSGHDLMVCGFEPHTGLHIECGACLGFSLPLPFSRTHALTLSLSLSLSKISKKKKSL